MHPSDKAVEGYSLMSMP